MKRFIYITIIFTLFGCQEGIFKSENSLKNFTIDQFMKIYSAGGIRTGTNGFSIYSTWTTGVTQIYQYHKSNNHKQISHFKEGIDWYNLSPDGSYIVAGISEGGNEQSKLWLYNTISAQWRKLPFKKGAKYGNIDWHRGSKWFYYHSNEDNLTDFHLYIYDITSQKNNTIFAQKGAYFISDSNKRGNILIITHYVSNEDQHPYLFDLKTKTLTPILWKNGQKYRFNGLTLSHDEKEIYMGTNLLSDRISLAKYNIQTKKVTPILRKIIGKWSVSSFTHNLSRTSFAFTLNENGYSKAYITSPANWKTKLFNPLGEGMYYISQLTKDKIYFTFQSAKKTQDAYFIKTDFSQAKPVQVTHSPTQNIPLNQFRLPQLIHYKSFDQLKIPALLYLPPNYKGGKAIPFIIHAHGGPESQFRPWFVRHFQFLLSRGYGILAPNVRGSKGYGKKYMALDNYKKRKDSVKDYYYAVQWLINKGYTKKGLIGVKGGSYGGYIVMALITDYPDLFSAAVNSVGIVNFVTFLKNTKSYRRSIREKEYGPLSDTAFLKSISPIHKIDQIKTPLLVVHGKNDPRVPVDEANQIMSELKKLNRTVEGLIFDDEGHGIRKLKNRLLYYRKMVSWFNTYLIQK